MNFISNGTFTLVRARWRVIIQKKEEEQGGG